MALFFQQSKTPGSFLKPSGAQNTPDKPSLFDSSTNIQPQQSGGLFGSSTSSSQPQSGGLFGNTSQAIQSQQSNNPLGITNQNSQPQQAGGPFNSTSTTNQSSGLFGSTSNTNQSNGGLFGGRPSTNTLPSGSAMSQPQSGGLFGNTNQSSQPQQSGGLFGGLNQNSQMQQSGGLFGSSLSTTQQPPSGGLFGNQTTANTSAPSLFSRITPATNNAQSTLSGTTLNQSGTNQSFTQSLQQQPNRPSLSLFASNSTNPTNPLARSAAKLPSLSLGQSTQVQPQSTGAKIDIAHLRGTTRFQDLTDTLQNEIIDMERLVQAEVSACEQISAALPRVGQDVAALPAQVEYIEGKIEAVENAVDGDGAMTRELKDIIQADADDCTRVFRCVENLKQPESLQYHAFLGRGGFADVAADGVEGMDLMGFFDRQTEELKRTLGVYEKTLEEIEAHLKTVELGVVQMSGQMAFKRGKGKEEQVRELAAVLREFEGGILGVASKVGECREGAQDVVMSGR